ncbi:ankyrin-1-like [Trichogramma pretiosum]|uniref:ankyrin-1-like n=1 Tax=Trichogramma pretiosum TaxID=7493 RepID=UPI0006C9C91A|nr:ankyrin-1-like [Trichogramma pretiosum]
MRMNVKWEIEEERRKFRLHLYRFIHKWEGPLPNLLSIFRRDEIDWLITDELEVDVPGPFIGFAISAGYKDKPDLDKNRKPWLRRITPVHRAAKLKNRAVYVRAHLKGLFKIFANFNVNYADGCGLTHFHIACLFGLEDVVEKFLERGQDPNCRAPLGGDSPLHLIFLKSDYRLEETIKLLLRRGANPNAVNEEGMTLLHNICINNDNVCWAIMLFKFSEKKYHPVRVKARDRSGKTPLHLALKNRNRMLVELLLKRGANPNVADKEGLTPLHIACNGNLDDQELVKMLFKFSNIKYHPLHINAQDNLGHTALHYALISQNKSLVKLLLKEGSDPNLATKEGSTSLHIIFNDRRHHTEFAKILFELSNEKYHPLQVNARDKWGRTPLQLAVAHLLLNEIDVLLDHGTDLSNFAFPDIIVSEYYKNGGKEFLLAPRVLAIVERLEKRGYELYRSDALKIMKFFAECKLFANSIDRRTKKAYKKATREFIICQRVNYI